MQPTGGSGSGVASAALAQASKYLKDPEDEFSSSSFKPKLGVFPFNFQSGPPAQNSLTFNIRERSKRSAQIVPNHPLFVDVNLQALDEDKRKLCREALQQWHATQQQRERDPSAFTKEDGLFRFLDHVHKKELGGLELDEWLSMFAGGGQQQNTSTTGLFEFIETFGCPEPKRFVNSKGGNWVAGLLDAVCDKRVPSNRAVWLIKYAMLSNLGKEMKMHLAPIGWTTHMLGWLGKLVDTMGKGMDAENRWKRGTSLVRWMFEDGLLSAKVLFEELCKIWRTACGVGAAGPAAAATASGVARLSGGGGVGVGGVINHKLYSDRVQMLVCTEVASYAGDAVRLGYAREFHDCAVNILATLAIESLRPLFELAIALCQVELRRDDSPASSSQQQQQQFWREDQVQLAWELERLMYSVEDADRLGRAVWGAVRRCGFAVYSPAACTALVKWCRRSPHEEEYDGLDWEERTELVCFALLLIKQPQQQQRMWDVMGGDDDVDAQLVASLLSRRAATGSPSPSCLALCTRVLDCAFEMDSAQLVDGLLLHVHPPAARVRAMCWLVRKCSTATLHLALLPVIETALVFRRAMLRPDSELRQSVAARGAAIPQELESRRLHDLLRASTLCSPAAGGGGGGGGGGATAGMIFVGSQPLTPQFPSTVAGAGGGGPFYSTNQQQHAYQPSQQHERKRVKHQNSMLYDFEYRDDAAATSPAAGGASPFAAGSASSSSSSYFTPGLLQATGYAGELARYEFGLYRLQSEPMERIVEELRREPNLCQLVRDFTCCRSGGMEPGGKDRAVLLGELFMLGGRHLEDAVRFGLLSLEDVLLEWISKRYVPTGMPLCPVRSHALVRLQWKQLACFGAPSHTLFRLVNHFVLLGKTKSDAFADMYGELARVWAAQGPGAMWLRDTKRFPDDAREMLKMAKAKGGGEVAVAFAELWRDPLALARWAWFVHQQQPAQVDGGGMLSAGLNEEDEGVGVPANVAAVVKAWDVQDAACHHLLAQLVKQQSSSFPGCALFARLLSLAAAGDKMDAVRREVVAACLTTSTTPLVQQQYRLVAAALFRAPLGTIAPEDALHQLSVLTTSNSQSAWLRTVVVELLRQAAPLHQTKVDSLGVVKQAWRLLSDAQGAEEKLGNRVRKAMREEQPAPSSALLPPSQQQQGMPPARTKAENMIRLGGGGGGGVKVVDKETAEEDEDGQEEEEDDDTRFVDSWLVLECAYDTLANQAFMRPPPPPAQKLKADL